MNQIVLPTNYRKSVLHLVHTPPTAGHLGQKKTAEWILNKFHWPTLNKEVVDFCRSNEKCQKSSHQLVLRVPMISVQVVEKHFCLLCNGHFEVTAKKIREPIHPHSV